MPERQSPGFEPSRTRVSVLDPPPFSWRISRYEPELRRGDPQYESWTDYADVGQSFNGLVLTLEEYFRVEDAYIAAALAFAVDMASTTFRVAYLGHHDDGYALSEGQRVVRSDIAPVVRGNLRGKLDCVLESADGSCQIAFGYDLYMYVAARTSCEEAVAHTWRMGLWVEPGLTHSAWEPDDEQE